MSSTGRIIIDPVRCIGCGACTQVCPKDTIGIYGEKAQMARDSSIGCGQCAAVCPADAIQVPFIDETALSLSTIDVPQKPIKPGESETAELVRLMYSRRSCRRYQKTTVPRTVLEDLVRIGTSAPSGSNDQLWTFSILPDRAAVETLAGIIADFFRNLNRKAANSIFRLLAKATMGNALDIYYRDYFADVERALRENELTGRDRLFHGAPAVILIGSEPGGSCPTEDACLAAQNIMLAAHTMGYGSCLIGFAVEAMKHDPSIARRIGIPDREKIHAVIALGEPDITYLRYTGRRAVIPRILGS